MHKMLKHLDDAFVLGFIGVAAVLMSGAIATFILWRIDSGTVVIWLVAFTAIFLAIRGRMRSQAARRAQALLDADAAAAAYVRAASLATIEDTTARSAVARLLDEREGGLAHQFWCAHGLGQEAVWRGTPPTLHRAAVWPTPCHNNGGPIFEHTPFGARITVKMNRPFTDPADYQRQLTSMAGDLEVDDIRLAAAFRGTLTLDLITRNPLFESVLLSWPIEELTDLAAVLVGKEDTGEDYRLRIAGAHLLLAGLTGSGKSSALWSIMTGLAPGVRDGRVQIHMIDLKGGMEMSAGGDWFKTFAYTPEDAIAVLQMLRDTVLRARIDKARTTSMRTKRPARKHVATSTSPHHVLIIDEIMALLTIPDRNDTVEIEIEDEETGEITTKEVKLVDYAKRVLIELLTQARAVGLTVIAATQNAAKAVMEMLRDLFTEIYGLRMASTEQERMVFGPGAREQGVRCTEITIDEAGTVYITSEEGGTARRARFFHVTDDDIEQLCTDYAHEEELVLAGAPQKYTSPSTPARPHRSAPTDLVDEGHTEYGRPPAADGGKIVPFRHPERGGKRNETGSRGLPSPTHTEGNGGKAICAGPTCENIVVPESGGRPRKYCSDACKRAAFKARHAEPAEDA